MSGGYSNKFSDLREQMDWAMKQTADPGDRGDPDKFRSIPRTLDKKIATDVLKVLANAAPSRYETEKTIRFYDSTDEATLLAPKTGCVDIDLNSDLVDEDSLTLPARFRTLINIWDEDTSRWVVLYDSSQAQLSIYSPAANEIRRTGDNWTVADTIRCTGIYYPKPFLPNISATAITGIRAIEGGFIAIATTVASSFFAEDQVTLSLFEQTEYNDTFPVVHVSDSEVFIYAPSLSELEDEEDLGKIERNTDEQVVEIDDAFFPYLVMEMKRTGWSRAGRALSPYEWTQLTEMKRNWSAPQQRVHKRGALRIKGAGYGRR